MGVNYANGFDPRDDNLYPNDPSLVAGDLQLAPLLPHSDPNFCFDTVDFSSIPLPSFDPLLDPLDFSLDSSASPTEIQSGVPNNGLPSSFDTRLPYGGSQYPPWDLFTMNETVPESYESIQVFEQTVTDKNDPDLPNGTTHASPSPKLNQHNRPHICTHKSCTLKRFSNKSGLERHKREVHSSQQFTCSLPSCDRSKKGFHRKYNLFEHQRRVHGSQSQSQSSDSSQGLHNDFDDPGESEGTISRTSHDMDPKGANRDAGDSEALPQNAALNSQEGFRSELRRLKAMRDELNEDIKSMERVLSIMGDEC